MENLGRKKPHARHCWAFGWHSESNVKLLLPLLCFLRDQCDLQIDVITGESPGKIRFIRDGFNAYTYNEIAGAMARQEGVADAGLDDAGVDDLISVDQALSWRRIPLEPLSSQLHGQRNTVDYGHKKVREAIDVYSALLSEARPALVLTWNGTSVLTGAIASAARKLGIPVLFVERGLLPGTLVVDFQGVNSASSFAGSNWGRRSFEWTPSATQQQRLKAYCTSLAEKGRSIVNAGFRDSVPELRARFQLSCDRKTIFVPLQIETDSNIVRYSPFFKRMVDVVEAVAQVTTDMQVDVIVKPHPENRSSSKEIEEACNRYQHLRLTWDCSIHSLLDVADLVIAINSTVGLEATMRNRPVLTLGRSAYDRKGFTRDIAKIDDLQAAIGEMLVSPLVPHSVPGFWSFINYLCSCASFPLEEDGHHCGAIGYLQEHISALTSAGHRSDSQPAAGSLRNLVATNLALRNAVAAKSDSLFVGGIDNALKGARVIGRDNYLSAFSLLKRYDVAFNVAEGNSWLTRLLWYMVRADEKYIIR